MSDDRFMERLMRVLLMCGSMKTRKEGSMCTCWQCKDKMKACKLRGGGAGGFEQSCNQLIDGCSSGMHAANLSQGCMSVLAFAGIRVEARVQAAHLHRRIGSCPRERGALLRLRRTGNGNGDDELHRPGPRSRAGRSCNGV